MAELRGSCYDLCISGNSGIRKTAELRGSCYDLCVSGNSRIRKTAELRGIATNCARPEILDSRKTAEWRRGPFHQAVICAFNYIRHLILQTSPIKSSLLLACPWNEDGALVPTILDDCARRLSSHSLP